MSMLPNFANRSGEFCVPKVFASTWTGPIGAIHSQILTEPVTSPSKLINERRRDMLVAPPLLLQKVQRGRCR